jgi:hypothetical protein
MKFSKSTVAMVVLFSIGSANIKGAQKSGPIAAKTVSPLTKQATTREMTAFISNILPNYENENKSNRHTAKAMRLAFGEEKFDPKKASEVIGSIAQKIRNRYPNQTAQANKILLAQVEGALHPYAHFTYSKPRKQLLKDTINKILPIHQQTKTMSQQTPTKIAPPVARQATTKDITAFIKNIIPDAEYIKSNNPLVLAFGAQSFDKDKAFKTIASIAQKIKDQFPNQAAEANKILLKQASNALDYHAHFTHSKSRKQTLKEAIDKNLPTRN